MINKTEKIIQFTLIFNKYKTKVYNYVLKMINDKMTSEDIVQSVFLKLYEHYDSIENKENIHFWIFRVARNKVYEYYRSKGIKVDQFSVDNIDEIDIPDNDVLSKSYEISELRDKLNFVLGDLPVEQREIYLMKEYEGFSYREISALLSISEDLVKSRLFKIRNKIIKKLQNIYK